MPTCTTPQRYPKAHKTLWHIWTSLIKIKQNKELTISKRTLLWPCILRLLTRKARSPFLHSQTHPFFSAYCYEPFLSCQLHFHCLLQPAAASCSPLPPHCATRSHNEQTTSDPHFLLFNLLLIKLFTPENSQETSPTATLWPRSSFSVLPAQATVGNSR